MCRFSSVFPRMILNSSFISLKLVNFQFQKTIPLSSAVVRYPRGVHQLMGIFILYASFLSIFPVMLKWVLEMWEDLIPVTSQIIVPRVWVKTQRCRRLCHLRRLLATNPLSRSLCLAGSWWSFPSLFTVPSSSSRALEGNWDWSPGFASSTSLLCGLM